MRIVAVITQRAVIDWILAHLEQRTATLVPVNSRAPPPSAMRSSRRRAEAAAPHRTPTPA